MIGPTPKMSVVLVCAAATMLSRRARTSLSWRSSRWRSSTKSAASSWRAVSAASSGWIVFSTAIACGAEISPANPPGTSSHKRVCKRFATRLRVRAMSRRRRTQTLITAACPSLCTSGNSWPRSAATATDRASLGSFLLTCPVLSRRTRAASLGCTSTTFSPAATSCCASNSPSPAAPSIAHAWSGQVAPQARSCSACRPLA